MNSKTPRNSVSRDGEKSESRDRELLSVLAVALVLLILLLCAFVPVAWRRAKAAAAEWELTHPNEKTESETTDPAQSNDAHVDRQETTDADVPTGFDTPIEG